MGDALPINAHTGLRPDRRLVLSPVRRGGGGTVPAWEIRELLRAVLQGGQAVDPKVQPGADRLATACTRSATRRLSNSWGGLGGRVMPGVRRRHLSVIVNSCCECALLVP